MKHILALGLVLLAGLMPIEAEADWYVGVWTYVGTAPSQKEAEVIQTRYHQEAAGSKGVCLGATIRHDQLTTKDGKEIHWYQVLASVKRGCACCDYLVARKWLYKDEDYPDKGPQGPEHYCSCGPGVR